MSGSDNFFEPSGLAPAKRLGPGTFSRFGHVKLEPTRQALVDRAVAAFDALFAELEMVVPPSVEGGEYERRLEEACVWAKKAIVRHALIAVEKEPHPCE